MKLRKIILVSIVILISAFLSYSQDGWESIGYIDYVNEHNPTVLNDSLILIITSYGNYSMAEKVEIYNMNKKPAQLYQRWAPKYLKNFVISKSHHSLALIDWNGDIKIYDYLTGNNTHTYSTIDTLISWQEYMNLQLDIDSNSVDLIIYYWRSNTIQRWNLDTKQKVLDIAIDSLDFPVKTYLNKNNTQYIYSLYSEKVDVFNTKTGTTIATQNINQFNEPKSVLSFDENNLIYFDNNNHIKSINLFTGTLNYELPQRNSDGIINFCETPDGNHLIVNYFVRYDSTYFLIYDLKKSSIVDSVVNSNSGLQFLEFNTLKYISNDLKKMILILGKGIYCGYYAEMPGPAANIGIYNLETNKLSEILPQGYVGMNIESVIFSQNGKRLLIAGSDSIAVIWEPDSEKIRHVFFYDKLPSDISNSGDEIYIIENDSLYVYSIMEDKYINSIYKPFYHNSLNLPDSSKILVYTNSDLYIYDTLNHSFIDSIKVDNLFSNPVTSFNIRLIDDGKSVFLSNRLFECLTINLNTKEVTNRYVLNYPLINKHTYWDLYNYTHLLTSKLDTIYIWDISNSSLLYTKYLQLGYERKISFLNSINNIIVHEKYDYIENRYQCYGLNLETDKKCYFGGRNYPVFSPNGLYYTNWDCPAYYYYSRICDDLLVGVGDEEFQSSEHDVITVNNNSVKFNLIQPSNVELSIYSYLGYLVYQQDCGTMTEGNHTLSFDNERLTSGLYLLRLKIGEKFVTKKIIFLK
ncbi:MAG: T9SS type A sorting domain-containing protein [Ignavibacteriae bacterium]|nr:T9SS type A sorting domain-containing protein [Ignavibacteriota bacterium]